MPAAGMPCESAVWTIWGRGPRSKTEVVDWGRIRDFFGFNRAKAAVVEAAILATRVHLLSPDAIRADLARLAVLVEKTGGQSERSAFAFLEAYVRQGLEKQRGSAKE